MSTPTPAPTGPPLDPTEIEAAVRRYLARVARRYVPAAVGLLALILVLVFVPTVSQNSSPTASGGGFQSGAAGGRTGPGGTGGATGGPGGTGPGQASGFGSPVGSSGAGGAASGAGGGGAGGSTTAGGGSAALGSSSNVAKTGVTCGSGVRQFSWSKYAPPCVGAFTGNNGGATAPGVTPTTITLSYRVPNSAQQQAIDALAGAANINDPAYISDLQSYVNFFNKQFELYGRKVVLKPYNGQGDYINEDQGQGLAQAQADAVTASQMGAFGDVTFSLEASEPYEQDLAQEHVISFSSVAEPHSWFLQYSPYEFSVQGSEGTVGIQGSAAVVCRRLAGMKAIYSGNAGDNLKNRVFGAIYPENPHYAEEVDQYEALVKSECGLTLHPVIAYSINVAEYETEATQAVAQMKAAGVTTLLCACDPIFPILLTQAQQQQSYYPEIFTASFGDPVGRDYNQTAWKNTVAGGIQFPAVTSTEAYKAYQIGYPGQHPAEWPGTSPPYFYVPYYTLMHVFDALQAAGPDLTPQTFARGEFSLPPSAPGDVVEGQWVFGNQVYDPITSFNLAWWDPNYVSAFDNTKGGYRWCNGGQTYDVRDLAALGGPGQQLSCFGH